jgi:hypothetical protein
MMGGMVTCLPQSICSWNYRVLGLPGGEGATVMNYLSEQGNVSLGGVTYDVVKKGLFSGEWSLQGQGEIVAAARKPSAMFRSFTVTFGGGGLTLQAQSPFSRVFQLLNSERVIGEIRPAHPFTLRALMQCDDDVPQLVQLFAFWLVALSWRRTASKNH